MGCSIAAFKRKYWSWIGMTSFLLYALDESILDFYTLGIGDYPLMAVIVVSIITFGLIIFLLSKDVVDYFHVSTVHKIIAVILPILVYIVLNRDPNPNTERINFHYVDIIGEDVYFNDSLYTGEVFYHLPNGNMDFAGHVINGKVEGEWIHFHDNGEIRNTVSYVNGQAQGKDLSYFSDGVLKEEKHYQNGKLNGVYKLWLDKDQLEKSGTFKDHKKHGEWRLYEPEMIKLERYHMDSLIEVEYLERGTVSGEGM